MTGERTRTDTGEQTVKGERRVGEREMLIIIIIIVIVIIIRIIW